MKSLFKLICTVIIFVTASAQARLNDEEKSYTYSIGAIVRTLQLEHSYFINPIKSKSNNDPDVNVFCILCTVVKEVVNLPGRAVMALIPEPKPKQVLASSFIVAASGLRKIIQDAPTNIELAETISNQYGELFDRLDGILKPVRDEFYNFNLKEFSNEIANQANGREIINLLSRKHKSLTTNQLLSESGRSAEAFKNLKNKLSEVIKTLSSVSKLQSHEAAAYIEMELAKDFEEIITKTQQGEICLNYSREKVKARIIYLGQQMSIERTKKNVDELIEKYSSTEPEGALYTFANASVMAPGKLAGNILGITNAISTATLVVIFGGTGKIGSIPEFTNSEFKIASDGFRNSFREAGGILEHIYTGEK